MTSRMWRRQRPQERRQLALAAMAAIAAALLNPGARLMTTAQAKPPQANAPAVQPSGAAAGQRAPAAASTAALGSAGVTIVPRRWPPVVFFRLRLGSGSFADPADRAGQAALCWRAAFRAAGDRSQAQLARALDAIGADMTVRVGRQDTLVEATALASQLEPALALVADAVLRPRLSQADVDHARTQQLADVAARYDNDEALAHEALVRFAHRGGVAGRSSDGTAATLAKVTPATCAALHADVLRGATVQFGFAGDIDKARAHALLSRHFGALLSARQPARLAKNQPLTPPKVQGRRLLLLDHPGRKQATVLLGFPTVGATHAAALALRLADAVIGGAFTSRLNQRIREERGWTYSLQSFLRFSPNTGLWTVAWTPGQEVTAKSLDLAMRIMELAQADGVTAKEHRFAQGYVAGAQRYDMDTAEAELDARMHAQAVGLAPDWVDSFADRLGQLSRKQVNSALRAHVDPRRVVAVIVGDARKLAPSLKAARSGFAVEVLPYRAPPESARVQGAAVSTTPGPSPNPG